ncbi:MAG: trehalose-phosphatase [Microbacteriaceae bacterium]
MNDRSMPYLFDDPRDELAIESDLTLLAEAEWLIVALDFDGTLAPIVQHPEDARMHPAARNAITALLNSHNTVVALVSGRAITSLKQVANPDPRIVLIGSHGAEFESAEQAVLPAEGVLTELIASLQSALVEFPGIFIEQKPYGVAVHFRNVDPDHQAEVQAILAEHVLVYPMLMTRTAKMVLEFSSSHADKGDSLRMLSAQYPGAALFFAGDDLTDEDVFQVLPELSPIHLGIKIGLGDTRARYRLETLEQLPYILSRLDELRTLRPQYGLTNPADSV